MVKDRLLAIEHKIAIPRIIFVFPNLKNYLAQLTYQVEYASSMYSINPGNSRVNEGIILKM